MTAHESKFKVTLGEIIMKNRKIKALFGMFFALALALSSGTLLASAKTNKPAEIVLAEEEPDENGS